MIASALDTPIKRLLFAHAAEVQPAVTVKTATGNPATFTATSGWWLRQVKADFTAAQTGSGVPSPSNVRSITAIEGLTVYHSGEDTSAATEINVTWGAQADAIFGGSLDVLKGQLTVNRALLTIDGDAGWLVAGISKFYLNVTEAAFGEQPDTGCICNMYPFSGAANSGSSGVTIDDSFYLQYSGASYKRVWVYDTTYSLDEFKALLNETPLQVTYGITPVTYNLTSHALAALTGENNVWMNTGGTLTVKYLTA